MLPPVRMRVEGLGWHIMRLIAGIVVPDWVLVAHKIVIEGCYINST